MPTIDQLSSVTSLSSADQVPIYSGAAGTARKVSMPVLAAHLKAINEGEPDNTVYPLIGDGSSFAASAAPIVEGANVWLQIAPATDVATGVIALPTSAMRAEGQEVLVTCTKAVTTLTVTGDDAAAYGAPVTLAAHGFFRLRFDLIAQAWFRVG